ncbi:MAG: hypothetical protein A2745_02535 [Candidatus Harrisonbacteria bacterium RIFCSPHIGHO2_01_FULL_44_13]|uniref:Glycosyl transferase family 1 domain-containing protein n=1 Tax=Candidatus Harrisonbacteria bacterium RIFCSPLOWO2_01_FULL_44_18 TaxID=1798407 RepID=A0A1G1ZMN5_9BACT|nr:MAG: hypothetical protein A2745_02535 [Candidatus Harrisonbacteria bacterium RIFCSPHIGHO2_01_FULL_44_13]OGY65834.1 MAG: hypothetical protein A3A16_02090 [Candidatus Harrisonbacteria bacterium RIFCSPLOWO2_01_FULL_44_18]
MRVALVYDYLNQYGGGERVLEVLMEIFPEAPIYALLYDSARTCGKFEGRKIIASFLNFFPGAAKHHRWFFPLMPFAVEWWDFSDFDLVISISASFAKGVKTKPPTRHLCYLLTPTRFLWDESEQRINEELPVFLRPLARLAVGGLRKWDFAAAQRPDVLIPISRHIKKEAREKYRRQTEKVIYPPVCAELRIKNYELGITQPFYLIVSRLIPYKRIDIAIKACESIGRNLKIIGVGRDFARLKKLAGKHTEFLGGLNDERRDFYLANAKAFLMPQVEDFGIAPVEAMARGTSVIAYAKGGALETIKDGISGIFFDQQTPESLVATIQRFEKMRFDWQKISQSVQKFSRENFKRQFLDAVKKF